MKLVKHNDGSIPVMEMQPGDLATITEWCENKDYVGLIVQRCGNSLVIIGSKDNGWGNLFINGNAYAINSRCRVRILQPGELLEV